ncbi:MAG: hypothetical protein WCT37_04980 [Patescibacteria group bacterium]|jgi:hypothetical protein
MNTKLDKFLLWTPRILGILFILFLMMFSLDVFDSKSSAWQIAAGLLIHNLPALILLAVLIISWHRPLVGGLIFILAGLAYILSIIQRGVPWPIVISWSLIIAGPALLTGVLFLLSWRQKRLLK